MDWKTRAGSGMAGVRTSAFLVEPDGPALTGIDAGSVAVQVQDVFPLRLP